jgi:lipoate-protein ligase A
MSKIKEEWRYLITEDNNAAYNMAIDKAVMIANSEKKVPPTIRFYTWKPPAISIGYFQSLNDEVDLDLCKKLGVNYVRRITGGGAVFHEKELTYSIVISESYKEIPKNIIDSYRRICGALIKGLKILGIESKYVPINDIITEGKKISGNAQTRKYKTILQHGTVLIDVNVDKMFRLLKIPDEKIRDKMISDAKKRVTSINHVLKKNLSFKQVCDSMKKGFEQEFNVSLIKGNLTREEIILAKKFEKEYFLSKEWNHKK